MSPVLVGRGPFPHRLEWVMRTTDFLFDGPELRLVCSSCFYQFGGASFIGPTFTLGDFIKHLARIEREAQMRIGDGLCPGAPTQDVA